MTKMDDDQHVRLPKCETTCRDFCNRVKTLTNILNNSMDRKLRKRERKMKRAGI